MIFLFFLFFFLYFEKIIRKPKQRSKNLKKKHLLTIFFLTGLYFFKKCFFFSFFFFFLFCTNLFYIPFRIFFFKVFKIKNVLSSTFDFSVFKICLFVRFSFYSLLYSFLFLPPSLSDLFTKLRIRENLDSSISLHLNIQKCHVIMTNGRRVQGIIAVTMERFEELKTVEKIRQRSLSLVQIYRPMAYSSAREISTRENLMLQWTVHVLRDYKMALVGNSETKTFTKREKKDILILAVFNLNTASHTFKKKLFLVL